MSSRINFIFLFTLSLLLFTLGLGSQEITGFDSRFYLFVQEMFRYGLSWFPMTYHQPYPDYPASSTFIIYLASLFFGGLNKWVAVLPTAILAAMTVSMTYLIGSLHDKHYGYCAAVFVLLTSAFVKSARSISLDMYPVVIATLCFYLLHSAEIKNKPAREFWVYPLLLLSFVFRGPIGLVIPAGVVCAYYLLAKNFRKLLVAGGIAFLSLAACTALLLALAYHEGGLVFMQNVLRMEVLGRMDNPFLPKYFYLSNSFKSYALIYPLAFLVLLAVLRNACLNKKLLLQLFAYAMVILIGMSIPDDKKIRYVLAMTPAIALIAALPFSASGLVFLRALIRRFLLVFPLILLLLFIAASYSMKRPEYFFFIHFRAIIFILAALQMVNLIALFFCVDIKIREKIILTLAATSFMTVHIMVAEPVQLAIDKSRDFVASIEAKRLQKGARLVFYRELPDGLPIKYLINMNSNDQPEFIPEEQALLKYEKTAFFVASTSYYNELPKDIAQKFSVLAENTLGHVRVIVFTRKE